MLGKAELLFKIGMRIHCVFAAWYSDLAKRKPKLKQKGFEMTAWNKKR